LILLTNIDWSVVIVHQSVPMRWLERPACPSSMSIAEVTFSGGGESINFSMVHRRQGILKNIRPIGST